MTRNRRRCDGPASLAVRLSAQGYLRLALAQALTFSLGAGYVASAAAAPAFGSAAWFAQAQSPAAGGGNATKASAQTAGAGMSAVTTPQQALVHAQRSMANLNRAITAIQQAQRAQQQAAQLSMATTPDGLGANALLVAAGAEADARNPAACVAAYTCLWQNAALPTQQQQNGQTTVTVQQTAKKAILSWDSFNVGANTIVNFDQHLGTQKDGNNDWVALNRVSANAAPSQIHGQIKADGSVYLINPNGVIFGAGSQVNTHALLVSSLPLYLPKNSKTLLPGDNPAYLKASNQLFMETGISSVGPGTASGNLLGIGSGEIQRLADNTDNHADSGNLLLPGAVKVEAGAALHVDKLGYAVLAAPSVSNAGTVSATDGQVILAAGVGVALKNPASGSLLLNPVVSGSLIGADNQDKTPVGVITNSGVIDSVRGDARLLAARIDQQGIVRATTSVSRPGSIIISAQDEQAIDSAQARTGSLVLAQDSVTALLPDNNGETTISSASASQTFQPGVINLSGATVTLQPNALIEAPGQKVSLTAIGQHDAVIAPRAVSAGLVAGRVYLDRDAAIDVAGLADIKLSVSTTLVTIPRLGLNELADSPLQRNGVLYGKGIVIDSSLSGTRADGVNWVGTPLANLSGYVQQVARGIDLLLQNGGVITLAGNEVLTQSGSQLNLDGGFIHYQGGYMPTTRLLTASGGVIDIANADPNVNYVGIAGQFVDEHARWNSSDIYINPILRGDNGHGTYVSDYIKGGNAGTLNVYGLTSAVLSGDLSAQAFSGRNQVASSQNSTGGAVNFGAGNGAALTAAVLPSPVITPAGSSYVVVKQARTLNQLADGFDVATALPVSTAPISDTANVQHWVEVDADKLQQAGVSVVNILADDPLKTTQGGEVVVNADAELAVKAGGQINLTGARVSIDGKLTAPAGAINITATGRTFVPGSTSAASAAPSGDITLGEHALLSARGQWVNDTGLDADQRGGSAYVNGGTVSLVTQQNAFSAPPDANGQIISTDTTGSITLSKGSLIDVSSGGRVSPGGTVAQKNMIPQAKGGSISLQTYVPAQFAFGDGGAPPLPSDDPVSSGRLNLAGELRAFGFSGGGTLSLRALGIQIGGETPVDRPWTLVLPENYFDRSGFGHIYLQAEYDAAIASLTTLTLSQYSFVSNDLRKLADVGSGADLWTLAHNSDFLKIDQVDAYHRQPVNFTFYGGDFATWHTSDLGGPPPDYSDSGISGALTLADGAVIKADPGAAVTLGSMTQVTVKGSVIAHGGSITLTADTAKGGYAQVPGLIVNGNAYTSDNKSVWLGADSLLDVSGTTLLDPLASPLVGAPVKTGKVLAGGTVTLSNDTGYVIALDCRDSGACAANSSGSQVKAATINVSGAKAVLDLPSADNGYQSQSVASDAGTIRIGAAKGLFFHGKLLAHGGDASTEGGTLAITPEIGRLSTPEDFSGAKALHLTNTLVAMPTGAKTPGQNDIPIEADAEGTVTPSGMIHFASASLQDSGITTLHLGIDPLLNSAHEPLPTLFSEDVSFKLDRALTLNTSRILGPATSVTLEQYLDADDNVHLTGKVIYHTPNISVTLSAPYVNISGLQYGGNYPLYYSTDEIGNTGLADLDGNLLAPVAFAKDQKVIVEKLRETDEGTTTTTINVYAPTLDGTGLNYTVDSRYREDGEVINSRDDETFADLMPKFYQSKLTINADSLDIGGQMLIDGFASVSLNSSGDLRFITPSTYDYLRDPANPARASAIPGLLQTTAELNLSAGQIYPASGNKFIINALGYYENSIVKEADDPEDPETTYTYVQHNDLKGNTINIRKAANSKSATPLSVGGSLVFNAANINQGGVIRAPEGQIVLGAASATDGDALKLLAYQATGLDGASFGVQVPVIATDKVRLLAGSETSVSLNGLVLPYGVTADSQNLQYNGSATSAAGAATAAPTLTSAPLKQLAINGQSISLDKGATIDIAGGGDLQAQEWIAGTGGSRDVLSAYNISYATGSAKQTPLYADGRPVYAVLPGVQARLAAYDPQLTADPLLGKAVYLSGVEGLPAGVYTLLPGRYATLPGAFRVVQETGVKDALASRNLVLPDGTARVAGYFTDLFSGAKDARTSSFLVQSGQVWQQYSQYQLTSLNDYFAGINGNAQSVLPKDAGQLVLNASASLTLGAKVNGQAVAGGLGADININAPKLQIADSAAATLGGYVRVDAAELNKLNASRLILGGISTVGEEADILRAGATQVVVDTTATALSANEIIVLAQSPLPTEDNPEPEAGAVTIKAGSILRAEGQQGRSRNRALQVGALADVDDNGNDIDGANGDGGLLRLSSGKAVDISRVNVAGIDGEDGVASGLLRLGDGVKLQAQGAVTLDAAGNTIIAPTVSIQAASFDANAADISFTNSTATTTLANGLVVGPQLLAQLAAIDRIALRSRGDIHFNGELDLHVGKELLLSGGNLLSDGSTVTIHADRLTLANELETPTGVAVSGNGMLNLRTGELWFGNGQQVLSGFAQVDMAASHGMLADGEAHLDFGAADVRLHSPLLAAGNASTTVLATTGALSIDAANAGEQTIAAGMGGKLSLQANTLTVDSTVAAKAGVLTLKAGSGGLTVAEHGVLDSSASAKTFFDVSRYAPAGTINLDSDGALTLAQGSVVDFSAADGGDAGRLAIQANGDSLSLLGQLRGQARAGQRGGSVSLNSRSAVSLDALADLFALGGINHELNISSASGNLLLSADKRLSAGSVTLSALHGSGAADRANGNVVIDGVINAAGVKGGQISLTGRSSVQVNGALQAAGAGGGSISLTTQGQDNGTVNQAYGYQQVEAAASGMLVIGDKAVLDAGDSGLVRWRAPLLTDGRINLQQATAASINGQRRVEAVASWSTTDNSSGDHHFDGWIDPAGRYDDKGVKTAVVNLAHRDFYSKTLADFVSNLSVRDQAGRELQAHAAINLVNPSAAVNNGDIQLVSHWNLAAQAADGRLLYRSADGLAPVLTLSAMRDINVNASLSDGFAVNGQPLAFNPGLLANANGVSPTGLGLTLASLTGGDSSSFDLQAATGSIRFNKTTANSEVVWVYQAPLEAPRNADDQVSYSATLSNGQPLPAWLSFDPLSRTVSGSKDFANGNLSVKVVASHSISSGDDGAPATASTTATLKPLVTPTMVRTGVGSINLQAAQDIAILDDLAPAVIYSAGRPASGTAVGQAALVVSKDGMPLFVNSGAVNPEGAGAIGLHAGRDIIAIEKVVDSTGKITGDKTTDLSQFWWPWLQNPCLVTEDGCGRQSASSINFGMFGQGVMSVGGDISVEAGRHIKDLSVSLPTTWRKQGDSLLSYGGGDLQLTAGGNLFSGSYFVGKGEGDIRVGGLMTADISDAAFNRTATLLAVQDGKLNVVANSYMEIGGIYNPSWLFDGFDSQSYSASSAVKLLSVTSSLLLGNMNATPGSAYGVTDDSDSVLSGGYSFVLPAHLQLDALQGAITLRKNAELYPSADGQLSLIADKDITLINADVNNSYLGLIDTAASALPSPFAPVRRQSETSFIKRNDKTSAFDWHSPDALHRYDSEPLRIYSLNGSLINGFAARNYNGAMIVAAPKAADIRTGLDIVNLSFMGQNLYDSDLTSISAGRDLYNTPLVANLSVPFIELGGGGTLAVSAGRNIGPLTSANEALTQNYLPAKNPSYPGIRTVGNSNNAYLPRQGASLAVAYGLSPAMTRYQAGKNSTLPVQQVAVDAFAGRYLDPAIKHDPLNPADSLGTADYSQKLVAFVGQLEQDGLARAGSAALSPLQQAAHNWSALDAAQKQQFSQAAWSVFGRLPAGQRQLLVTQVFLDVLNQVGFDYNNSNSRFSGQYGRGYQAINTLFPAAAGFTANNRTGGQNGAQTLQATGTLDMRGSTLQTQHGGDISIVGPGGKVLVGSTSAPPQVARSDSSAGIGPNNQGILTLESGKIGIFSDNSVLLAQSRIFTEQGGDVLIWSSNGDINAGKGAKTSSEAPPPEYQCDRDHFCLVDAKSQVSGAGIAVLQTKANAPSGSANLIAPSGTVDAGDAGIRVSGSLNVAAFKVANADNIQVQGKSVGVPTAAVDSGAMAAANSVSAAAVQSASAAAARQQPRRDSIASDFLFEFIGGDE